ncbi:MAG: response regulator [Lachnospiraceae bacterium]|nr:response regulator [Lachnospiraceae bacterium]
MLNHVEVDYFWQIALFVLLNGCGSAMVYMGYRIYRMNREIKLNRRAMWLYLFASVWVFCSGYMGIMKEADYASGLLRIGFIGNVLWFLTFPSYLMDSVFLSNIKKSDRRFYFISCILMLLSMAGLTYRYHPQYVSAPYGMAYTGSHNPWLILYICSAIMLLLQLGSLIFRKWKPTSLKRDKRLLNQLTHMLFLLTAGLFTEAIIPAAGGYSFPAAAIAVSVVMGMLYRVRKEVEDMSINVEMAARHIYESVPMPVLIIQRDHTIQAANRYACRFFEMEMEELLGQFLDEIVANSFFSLKTRFEDEVKKRKKHYEVSVTCKKNRIVCGIKYNVVYDQYGDCVYAILTVNNISRQYVMLHKLEESRSRAEIANQAKSEFLANMSHEIRTPLNVILGMGEMILRESKEPGMLEYADNIKDAANSMINMVNDILDMSKMEDGRLEMLNVDYEIRKMTGQIMEMVKERIKNKHLELECVIDPELPNCLWGDEVRIRQIINNFLSNAEKFTKEGRIILRMWGEYKDEETINLTVVVEDTGIGIRKEDHSKMFRAFDRVNLKENRSISGLGLGLTIARNIVAAMGGEVDVESEYGKGSAFSFTIPQHVRNKTLVGDFNEWYNSLVVLESGREARSLYAPEAQILVVDDTNVNLEVVKALLKRTKMQVDVAHSGAECLEKVTRKKYHIILMDHMMPEMDGIETLHMLKTMENNRSLEAVVIALTANAVAGARETYLASGFDDYLKKPVKSVSLEQMLVKYLPEELVQLQKAEISEITGEEWADMAGFKHINVRTGLVYTDNNTEMLQGIMKQYLNTGRKNVEDLDRARKAEDWKTYGILVHALKSTSLNIGAEKMSTQAKMMEAAVKKERLEYIQKNHERILAQYQAILDELSDYFEEVSIGENSKKLHKNTMEEIKQENLSELLCKLKDKLEISITTEIEKVANELKTYSYKEHTLKERYKEIFDYIDEYEYEEAYTLIEEVIEKDG